MTCLKAESFIIGYASGTEVSNWFCDLKFVLEFYLRT